MKIAEYFKGKYSKFFQRLRSEKMAPAGQQAHCLFSDAKYRCQVSARPGAI